MDIQTSVESDKDKSHEDQTRYGMTSRLNPAKEPHFRKPRTNKIAVTMSTSSHIFVVGFTIYLCYLCIANYSFFSWHPACMTFGFFLLMAEAVMAMSYDNLLTEKLGRQGRVRAHWLLQASAAGFIFAGFLIIVINKNSQGKPHFQSWHGIFGLMSVILVGITSVLGVFTLYISDLRQALQRIRPATLKLSHNLLGIVTFVMGVITIILGLFTGWFTINGGYSAQIISSLVVAMGGILALESAIKSAYARFKAIYQIP